jgi:hypothetical protein
MDNKGRSYLLRAPSTRHPQSSILDPQSSLPTLFVGNFDFEHRLAYGDKPLPIRVEEMIAKLAPAWVAIAEPGDAVRVTSDEAATRIEQLAGIGLPAVRPVFKPHELPELHRPVFWGENESTIKFACEWRLERHGCNPTVVRRVNSRRFKHQLETKLGVVLDDAACFEDHIDLSHAIGRLSGRAWVLKGEFGGAGREVRFGKGALSSPDLAWIANRLDRGLAVTVEPHLDAIEEAGIQFEIHRDGRVEFLAVTPLLTRPNGGYLASGFRDDPSLIETWREAVELCSAAATRIAAEGYFGPLGIDAMRYRDASGTIRMRPLQDLNARYTMGRLALGLRRFPEFASRLDWIFRPNDFSSQT